MDNYGDTGGWRLDGGSEAKWFGDNVSCAFYSGKWCIFITIFFKRIPFLEMQWNVDCFIRNQWKCYFY